MYEFKPKITEKRWDPKLEEELLKKWDEEGLYRFDWKPGDPRPLLIIDTPPPYPSGKWHVGGAAHYAQIDMVARYFRMKGYAVLVPWYADRNGLPVEVAVEKKYGIVAHEMAKTKEGRLKFLELCKKELDEVEKELVRIWRRMGCSFEYWRNGTDSPEYRRITQATFIELWKKGLIYEAEHPVEWCPRCRTSLSEAEIEHREEEGYLYYVRWRVEETGEEIVIATTRPELIGATVAVVFNPEDERYKRLLGKHAIVPVYGYRVPILTHKYVDPRYGTGIMMVSTYGDWRDVEIVRDLGLKPRLIINPDGTLNEKAGPLAGLPVRKAREEMARILEEKGLLVKKERIRHSVPICWRCKTPVEIIHVKELFLKQLEFREELKKVVEKMRFHPEKHRRRLLEWIDSLRIDWPISRTRFYATEIPLWRCKRCGAVLVPEPGRYYRPWLEEPPWDRCPKCGAPKEELEGETRVFDTWFDSSISVLYVTGYLRNLKLFEEVWKKREMPPTLRPQGVDIIRTWLYYTILRVYQLLGKPAFSRVRISGMGLDPKGRPMHKSLGNVIDPEPILEKYGADVFRFWAAAAARVGDDYRFSEQVLETGRRFATKLWNIARFISQFPDPRRENIGYRLRPLDEALLAALADTVRRVDRAMGEELDFHEPINAIYEFTWHVFADHYIEAAKQRAYNRSGRWSREEQAGAWYTLHYTLDAILRMLAPIMPFVTDALYRRLYGESVHSQRFPEPPETSLEPSHFQLVMRVDSAIWGLKKKLGLRLSQELPGTVYVEDDRIRLFADELSEMHKVRIEAGRPEGGEEIGEGIRWVH